MFLCSPILEVFAVFLVLEKIWESLGTSAALFFCFLILDLPHNCHVVLDHCNNTLTCHVSPVPALEKKGLVKHWSLLDV